MSQPYSPVPNAPAQHAPDVAKPARKGFFARHKIVSTVLVVLAVVVLAQAFSGTDPAPAPAAAPTAGSTVDAAADPAAPAAPAAPTEPVAPAAPAAPAGPGIGTPAADGAFEFTVTSVEQGVARIGDQMFGEDAQGQFLLVHVTVKNVGDAAQYFDSSSQKLVDTQGREHSADTAAAIYLDASNSFLESINPGNGIEGILVFDVPVDAVPASIELHDSMFSGGITVTLG